LYTFIAFSTRCTCTTLHIFLNLIALISSTFCSLLQTPATSCLLGPNILLSLCYQTPSILVLTTHLQILAWSRDLLQWLFMPTWHGLGPKVKSTFVKILTRSTQAYYREAKPFLHQTVQLQIRHTCFTLLFSLKCKDVQIPRLLFLPITKAIIEHASSAICWGRGLH
jgi:hypothetical protein